MNLGPPYQAGVASVVAFVAVVLLGAGIVDVWVEIRRGQPVSYLLRAWARQYPLYSALLVALLGALLGHFFLHPMQAP